MVLRQRIRSVKVYPDQYTKNTQTVSQLKTRVFKKLRKTYLVSQKCKSLLHRKKFFIQVKKEGGVRPVGDLTVAALRSNWSEVRPINNEMSGIHLGI